MHIQGMKIYEDQNVLQQKIAPNWRKHSYAPCPPTNSLRDQKTLSSGCKKDQTDGHPSVKCNCVGCILKAILGLNERWDGTTFEWNKQ